MNISSYLESETGRQQVIALKKYLGKAIDTWEQKAIHSNLKIDYIAHIDLLDRCEILILTLGTDQEYKWAGPLYDILGLQHDLILRRKIMDFKSGRISSCNEVWMDISKRIQVIVKKILIDHPLYSQPAYAVA